MDRLITYSSESCFVCNEFMGSFSNELNVVTGYSEKPIYQLLENFTNISITEDILADAGVCQNCFIKFNEYDEYQTLADQIQSELAALFEANMNSVPDELKPIIKLEEVEDASETEEIMSPPCEYIFETVEAPKPIEEMYLSHVETIQDDNQFMVEVDWLEQKNLPRKIQQEIMSTTNKPQKVSRTRIERSSDRDDGLTVIQLENSIKLYQCEICSRTFKERSKLRTHREIHTNVRNVICPTCGKAFKTIACLRSHKRIHNPVFVFCDHCGKKFTQKQELLKHVKFVHFHKRDFVCEICSSGFGCKGHLKAHYLTHQEYRPVVCQVCGFRTHTKPKLDRHMKSHTGERNFECGICNKRFLYSYNVSAHIKHVHFKEKRNLNEDKLTCKFCMKRFPKIWKVKEHMAEVHQVIESEEHEVVEYFSQSDDIIA